MIRIFSYFLFVIPCVLTMFNNTVFAYGDIETHPQLTDVAVNKSNLDRFLFDFLAFEDGIMHEFKNDDLAEFENEVTTKTVLDWLEYGSEFEDISLRAKNHFHDPLRNTGLSDGPFSDGLLSGESNLIWAMETQNACAGDFKTNFKSNDCNAYSYNHAKNAYYIALTSQTDDLREKSFAVLFERLGRVLHLIEDMGVPAHTRNDMWGHLSAFKGGIWLGGKWVDEEDYYDQYYSGFGKLKRWSGLGNLYEYWVESKITQVLKQDDKKYVSELCSDRPPGIAKFSTPEQYWDRDVYTFENADPDVTMAVNGEERVGLAEYTNANYLSLAAMFTDWMPSWIYDKSYPFPRRDSTDVVPPAIKEITAEDRNYDLVLHLRKLQDGEIFDEDPFVAYSYTWEEVNAKGEPNDTGVLCYVLTDAVHEAYAKRLLPKTVGYSAGLLDYFFRGKIEATLDEVPIEIDPIEMNIERIKISARNITPGETMPDGKLTLIVRYRAYAEGPFRYIKKEFCSLGCAIPSDWSEDFYFDLDGDEIPLTAEDITLFLVYRGQLGEEEDGIAVGMIKDPLIPKLVQQPEVVPPESGVYALLDSVPVDPDIDGFDRIQFILSDRSGTATPPDDGIVTAVLWYRVSEGNPFRALPLNGFPRPQEGLYRQTQDFYGIYDFNDVAVDFDLTAQNLPLWATDVFLYLIYTSQNKAFCVMKDLSEPTPVDFYNYTDRVCLFGTLYDLVDYDGSFDQDAYEAALTAIDTDPTIGNNNNVADEWYIFPPKNCKRSREQNEKRSGAHFCPLESRGKMITASFPPIN